MLIKGGENTENTNGLTLLHLAILHNRMNVLTWLLSLKEVDVNKRASDDVEGNTAVHLAVIQGNLEAVKLLIEHGANVDLEVDSETPFQLAIKRSGEQAMYTEIVTYLFKIKIDSNDEIAEELLLTIKMYDNKKCKPLMKAALKCYFLGDKSSNLRTIPKKVFRDLLYEYFKRRD